MAALRQQRDPVRLLLKRISLIVLLVIVAAAASGVWGVYQKERESAVLREQAEHAQAELLEREALLKEDIAKLQTNRGMEEALREQYALAERGEGLIIIVEPPAPEPVVATSTVLEWLQRAFPWWR